MAEDEDSAAGLVGKKLGRYQIVAELGHGGMAAVYRAQDPQLGRDVAVKVMHGFLAGRPEIQKRFRREAQAVASLKHDAVVEVYDFEPAEGARPGYIVAELIRGPTLRQVLDDRGGRVLPEVAALIGARVADGLAAAHALGIVHRDIKPDNLMVDRPTEAARVVLADFGVAHIAGQETMTATGALVGSPAFMSPEQARGDDVGPPSDVFSLGVVLYHLCTGRFPFPGKDPLTTIAAILRGDFKRPSVTSAQVGPDMERIILRAMRQNPAERYPDARGLRDDLAEIVKAAGIADPADALHRFFRDPAPFETEIRPRVAAAAFDKARAASRRGDFTRALAEIGRTLAYEPGHAGAQRLLRSISTRRVGLRVAGALAAMLALGAGAYAVTVKLRAVPATNEFAVTSPAPPIVAPPPVAPAPPAAAVLPPSPSTSAEPARATGKRKAAMPSAKNDPTPTPVAVVATQEPEATPAPAPALVTPAPTPPARAIPTSIVINVRHGMCDPSVDDGPMKSAGSRFENLSPGIHRIYCHLDGRKVAVKPYTLGPDSTQPLSIWVVAGKPEPQNW